MCIVQKTKTQLYEDIPLFTQRNICKNKMKAIFEIKKFIYEERVFKDWWNCDLINKYILDNYKWEDCYEYWQIYQFQQETNISLYDFIKFQLREHYFSYWEYFIQNNLRQKSVQKP